MLTAGLALCCLSNVVGQSNSVLPSAVLNLTNWKVTLPIGSSGSPTEILQPALANFQDAYFYVNAAGNGVIFTAPCGGVATSGSDYPRSELREMNNNGTTLASWSSTSGTHTMEITEAITHLPVAKPQVIAGQVHDAATKVVDCRLNGGVLYIENASGGVDAVLTMSYLLGTVFTVKFVAANGGIAVYYNGRYIYTHSVSESGLYFKAGCYTQSNPSHGDQPTAYGQVVIYGLSVNSPAIAQADVAATCSGPTNVAAGASIDYSAMVINLGPSVASNVVVRDTLPAAATFVSADAGGTMSNGAVFWPAITMLPIGGTANFSATVTAPTAGKLTNVVASTSSTPDPDASNNNGSASAARVITFVGTPVVQADLAVFTAGPPTSMPGSNLNYTITVTNLGPSAAANVTVNDFLPSNVVYVGSSDGGSFSNGEVSWPVVSSLADNTSKDFTVTVTAPAEGSFTNRAAATSTTTDPNPANNDGTSTNSQTVTIDVVQGQYGVFVSAIALNPETGLFEQSVTVTNISLFVIPAMRLYVDGLRSGVQLYNASGTDAGQPYAQYILPLNPNQTVTFLLEIYVPDRGSFTDTLQVQAVVPAATRNVSGGFPANRVFLDSASPGGPRIVVEFNTIPGHIYTVIYSDDGMTTWKAATPAITATSTVTQWHDNGPPVTVSKPVSMGSRDYRVITGTVAP
jgi:poly(beta-D-mannuronate) lyase